MIRSTFILALSALAAVSACKKSEAPPVQEQAAATAQVAPPASGNWSEVITTSPAGHYVMGNPNAKVKIIEIASMSCPYCRNFARDGLPKLVETYVKPGIASLEFRPYLIHGPIDMSANLIVRCNGDKAFFPLVEAMYRDQERWIGTLQAAPKDRLAAIQDMGPDKAFVAMADAAGLPAWAAAHGIPSAKSAQCLSDQAMISKEVQTTADVSTEFPEFKGTPAFVVNGTLQPQDVVTFEKLEPALKQAQ